MERRRITPREIGCWLLLLCAAVLLFLCFRPQGTGNVLLIEQNGTTLRRVQLTTLTDTEFYTVGAVTVEITREGARFLHSPCPDQICVQTGWLRQSGETAVCLPERISLRILSEHGADGMTG